METAESGRPSCCIVPCLSARLASSALVNAGGAADQNEGIRGGKEVREDRGQIRMRESEGGRK